jgi:cyclomaltodextrinase
LTRVATALLLTLPGIPGIYTADEVGEWFRPYSDTTPVSWKERYPGLRDYHKQLIALRKEIPSLRSRLWQILEIEPERQVLGYIRLSEGDTDPVLVLLNFSKEQAIVKLTLAEQFSSLTAAGHLSDQLNNEEVPFNGTESIQMNPMSARILSTQKE